MIEALPYIIIGLSLLLIVLNFSRSSSVATHYIKAFIGLPETIVHEFCHALMAILTFGKAKSIQIFSNGEGLAVSATGSWFSRTAITLAGYIGASVIAYGFVHLLVEGQLQWIFYLFSGIAVFTLLYIRNFFGFFYVGLLNVSWAVILYYDAYYWQQLLTYYIVIVCLAYSLYSATVVMYLSWKSPDEAGDATNMKKLTYIPAQVWGVLFFIQAAYFYVVSILKLMA